jgi:hygromycin-B 7''-O-kinase
LRTPSLVAVGDFDQGSYLLMTQLPGHRLVEVWPELQADDRDRLADALGEALAALHALDSSALADLPPPHWPSFVPAQRASATARQRARGLAEPWLEQIDTFLDHWGAPLGDERVLLHTEVMREHLLAEHDGRGWRLGALIDFEPAMLGERDYEFASVGLFVSCGDGRLLRRLLRAYGWREALLDEALSCRLMAQALLHRYSHLRWYLERLPCPGARTLEQLACHWFALDADA